MLSCYILLKTWAVAKHTGKQMFLASSITNRIVQQKIKEPKNKVVAVVDKQIFAFVCASVVEESKISFNGCLYKVEIIETTI